MSNLPERQELIDIINQLKSGDIERTRVSQWAFSIIDDDDVRVTDQIAWKVIQSLGAVDLPSSDRDYLYGNDDFDEWVKILAA
jgi:hypothetical protein